MAASKADPGQIRGRILVRCRHPSFGGLKHVRCVSMAAPIFAFALFVSAAAVAQQAHTEPGPAPAELRTAKTVFVSNAGADSGLFPEPFSGDTSRGYNEFYSRLKTAGMFQLVDNPGQADLVLELQLTAPYGPSTANKVKGASDPLPMFRLAIYDARTHFVLWALTESIEPAVLQKTHDRNFDLALEQLLLDLEHLTGKTPAAPQ